MAPLISVIEIARPPQVVFAVATDPQRFADWQPDVVRVEMLDQSRFATTRRMTGGQRTLLQKITRNSPPDNWAAHAIEGPVRPHASITVEPINGGAGSRVTFTLDFEGHGLGVALVTLVHRQAEKAAPVSYANLKKLLEEDSGRGTGPGFADPPSGDEQR
jgi:uncharacterized protein YndB with AHSA1/START domain